MIKILTIHWISKWTQPLVNRRQLLGIGADADLIQIFFDREAFDPENIGVRLLANIENDRYIEIGTSFVTIADPAVPRKIQDCLTKY